uniref:Uncharacterized protein n=1 Tax=Tanacetum cinerariifolium TaxID=118510 RepID=A0A699J212_TANCI|nr:hypothetical protein [Tanacetum cinerariifolium]
MDKRKRFKLNLEIFRDIFKICPRVQGQDFDALPTDEEIMSFLRELEHIREINSLNDVVVDHMHQPWRTFVALIKKSLSGKTTEVLKKSMRDFYKTHPSGSGTITKTSPSVSKIKPSVTSEGIGVKLGVPDVAKKESSESRAKSWGNNEDDSNNEQDSNGEDSDQEKDNETKIIDKAEGDEKMDYTTSQLYDDVDIRLNEPVDTDKGFVEEEVPVSVISDSSPVFPTVIPQSLRSFTPPPKRSISTPPPTTKAINPPSTLLDFTSVFQFNNKVTALEKEVTELKKDDPLKTQVITLVDEHLDARLRANRDEFINYLLASITARITEQVKNQLPQILPKEEPEFEVADSDMPHDQEGNLGPTFRLHKGICTNYAELEYDFEECYKSPSKKLDWENPEGGDYPFDLTKPLPFVKIGNHQMVPVDYFFNNNLKYLQGGILTMTYTTSLTKIKVAQYDLPGIKDMVPNI